MVLQVALSLAPAAGPAGQPAACRLGCQLTMRACTDFGSGSVDSAVRKASSENISAISDRISRCCWVTWSGISRKNSRLTGLPSGESNGIGSARRTKAASGAFRVLLPLTLPCGTATPWPRPVEPSRSRANRLSDTVERAMPQLFSKISPACSKARFLLDTSRSSRTFSSESILLRLFITRHEMVRRTKVACEQNYRLVSAPCNMNSLAAAALLRSATGTQGLADAL